MKKNTLFATAVVLILTGVLCGACQGMTKTSSDSPSSTQAVETKINLYADFSAGSPDAESQGLIKSKEQAVSGALRVEVLAKGLSEWSGLDFALNGAKISGDSATVDWAANSTLVAGLGEREQKVGFHFYDDTSLNWFMLDSLARTIKKNLKVSTVYYSMDGGKPLVLEDMPCLKELPVDQPYEGSTFFCAHGDNMGDEAVPMEHPDLKAGAVFIESVAGIDADAGMTKKKAMDLLSTALTDRIMEGTALVANGEGNLEGQHCWTFSFGKNTAEKFTAEEHYAVTDDGKIYVLDIINNTTSRWL